MAFDGEALTQKFYLIAENPAPSVPVLNLPAARVFGCCKDRFINVFADAASADELTNDKTGFNFSFNQVVSSVTLTLEFFNTTTNAWQTAQVITDSSLGEFNVYGYYTEGLNKYISLLLDWRAVLLAYGSNTYRLKIDTVLSIGGGSTSYSPEYCLEQYQPFKADGTVKIEYYLNNIFGDNTDDKKRRNFADLNLYNSIRIPGIFGFNVSTYEREFIVYQNGARVWVKDEQQPEFTLKTKPLSVEILDLLRTDILQSENIFITDYNSKNPNNHIKRQVISNSDFAPNWQPLSKTASLELKFLPAFNNYKRKRC